MTETIIQYPAGPASFSDPYGAGHYGADAYARASAKANFAQKSRFDAHHYLMLVLRYRLLILSFLTIGCLMGALFQIVSKPIYQAQARIEIITQTASATEDLDGITRAADMNQFHTAVETLRSEKVLLRVAEHFRVDREVTGAATEAGQEVSLPVTSQDLADRLSVHLMRNTGILALSLRDTDPQMAQSLLNQIMQAYIDERAEQAREMIETARGLIRAQVEQLRSALQEQESALVAYAREHGINFGGEKTTLLAENMRLINAGLAQAVSDRVSAESRLAELDQSKPDARREIVLDPAGSEMRSRLVVLRAEYQEKRKIFKADYPEMQMLKAQISDLEGQLHELNEAVLSSLHRQRVEAAMKEEHLHNALKELEERHAIENDRAIRYSILKREVEAGRSQYEHLMAKLNEVGIGAGMEVQHARVLDHAGLPASRITAGLGRSLALGGLVSLGLSAGLITLLETFSLSFRSPGEVEAELQLPVLAALPHVSRHRLSNELGNQRSFLSESYRVLRSALIASGVQRRYQSLLVTSAIPSEGKSTTAYQVALGFAQLGRRVLLVDADLRQPKLHLLAEVENERGLGNILANDVLRRDFPSLFLQLTPNLTLLPAGAGAGNPVDILASSRLERLFHAFGRRYDLVIVDGPPVIGFADALVLTRLAEQTLMVVSANQVARKSAQHALRHLRAAGGVLAGVALTKFRHQPDDYKYEYGQMDYGVESELAMIPYEDELPRRGLRWAMRRSMAEEG